jgi:hypothetical protein
MPVPSPDEKEWGLFYFSCFLILIDLFIMYDLIEYIS